MVLAVVPFGNQARFVAVNGTTLKLMLENGLSDLNPNGGSGRFPAVHGIEFEYDPARPAGSRITTVTVRRRAFTPGRRDQTVWRTHRAADVILLPC